MQGGVWESSLTQGFVTLRSRKLWGPETAQQGTLESSSNGETPALSTSLVSPEKRAAFSGLSFRPSPVLAVACLSQPWQVWGSGVHTEALDVPRAFVGSLVL